LAYTHQNASFNWNKANAFSNYFKNIEALPYLNKKYAPEVKWPEEISAE